MDDLSPSREELGDPAEGAATDTSAYQPMDAGLAELSLALDIGQGRVGSRPAMADRPGSLELSEAGAHIYCMCERAHRAAIRSRRATDVVTRRGCESA